MKNDTIRCRYSDCAEQHPLAGDEEEQVTCPSCRLFMSLPTEVVYVFHPRRSDAPFYVAESRDELADKVGEILGAEQCDYCGNSAYRVERVGHGSPQPIDGYTARCVTDPNVDPLEEHSTGCGRGFPIYRHAASETQGFPY